MGKKLSEETVVSDSDESMQDVSEVTHVNKNKSKKERSSSSEEKTTSPGSGSESESNSSDDSESDTKPSSSSANSRLSTGSKRNNVFIAPSGFRQIKPKTLPSRSISSALSNLEGKQVFHITAPSSLPISQIQEISLGRAILGEPILSHKGVDYGLVANTQQQKQGSETLLVYDEATNSFMRNQGLETIDSYNIQEIVRLPGLDSMLPPQETAKKMPEARPQPKHLKMRFHPVGSSNLPPETVGSSSESEAGEPTFRVPQKEKDRKRKSENSEIGETSKKSKKEKHSSQDTDTRRDKEEKKKKKRKAEKGL